MNLLYIVDLAPSKPRYSWGTLKVTKMDKPEHNKHEHKPETPKEKRREVDLETPLCVEAVLF